MLVPGETFRRFRSGFGGFGMGHGLPNHMNVLSVPMSLRPESWLTYLLNRARGCRASRHQEIPCLEALLETLRVTPRTFGGTVSDTASVSPPSTIASHRMSKIRRCSPLSFGFALVSVASLAARFRQGFAEGVKPRFWFRSHSSILVR